MNNFVENGVIKKGTEYLVSAKSRGFRYGDGFFETMRVMNGVISHAELHFSRLFDALGLKGDFGALVMGILLAFHPGAGELAKSLLKMVAVGAPAAWLLWKFTSFDSVTLTTSTAGTLPLAGSGTKAEAVIQTSGRVWRSRFSMR